MVEFKLAVLALDTRASVDCNLVAICDFLCGYSVSLLPFVIFLNTLG
jgi:hypothetical protein